MGNYFFGGESFSAEGETAFYLQDSEAYPQQTTLLGMIRYQLLLQNGFLSLNGTQMKVNDVAKASLLVGGESFNPDANGSNGIPTFGEIQSLSPVFLLDAEGTLYAPFPKVKSWSQATDGRYDAQYHEPELAEAGTGVATLMGSTSTASLPRLAHYDPKVGFEWGFKSLTGSKWLAQDQVFESMEAQVGINKPHTLPHRQSEEQAEQDGFFKQTYRRLKAGFGFGAYLSLSNPSKLSSQLMVSFGKEQSPFTLTVQPHENGIGWEQAIPALKPGQALWFTSPAKVDAGELASFTKAMIGRQLSFRSMVSQVQARYNYFGNPRSRTQPSEALPTPKISQRYNLLDRGSLVWLRDNLSQNELTKLTGVLSDQAFLSIGYNHLINL